MQASDRGRSLVVEGRYETLRGGQKGVIREKFWGQQIGFLF